MDNNIDKWGSLSMPERASLISLFTGSGVTSLDEMRALYNEYGNGGGIHIDPSKKGTFTSAAKRHGMGVQEFASRVLSNKDDYSTAMVKKANFARNAAKWHEEGGYLLHNVKRAVYGDELDSATKITLQDQSRRGLKKAAMEAVFSDNPYNPDVDDTFLEDYIKDNNIVSFKNNRAKRIFDRNIRRNMLLKESMLNENGYGVVPTVDGGYKAIYGPSGRLFVRSEQPLSSEDAVMLAFMPVSSGSSLAEKGISSVADIASRMSPKASNAVLNISRRFMSPVAKLDHAIRPSTYVAKLMNRAGFSPDKIAAVGLATDIGAFNVAPGIVSYKNYINTGDVDYRNDAINSMIGIVPNIVGKYAMGYSYMDDYINRLNKRKADDIFNKTVLFDSRLANSSSFRNRPTVRKVSRLKDAFGSYSLKDNVVKLPYSDNAINFSRIGNTDVIDATLAHDFQHALTNHSSKSVYTVPFSSYYSAAPGYNKFRPFYNNTGNNMLWESSPDEFISNMAKYNNLMNTSGKRLNELNLLQRRNYVNNMSNDFNIPKKEVENLIMSFENGSIY